MSEKAKVGVRANYVAWYMGEMVLNQAILHLKQQRGLESGWVRKFANDQAQMLLLVALGEIVRERAQASAGSAQ